jgi:hypothetical protein
MSFKVSNSPTATLLDSQVDRRHFFRQSGLLGLGAATSGLLLPNASGQSQATEQAADTATEIFTAALVAEDLATTFYYNGLVGKVLQDPALAGSGGGINDITNGNQPNLQYIQAALTEEINHANLFRSLLGGSAPTSDPYQTFYFPQGTFELIGSFLSILSALENAFIGAYLNAIQEFAYMAAHATSGSKYTATQLEYYAKVAATIMGIECEHRVLGNVIANVNPSNNLNYEQTDGIDAVYNGPNSAFAALVPFVTPSTGPGYSLQTALEGAGRVGIVVPGAPPSM